MRIRAHLEQACYHQQTHAEPCQWFKSLLKGGDKAELVGQFQGPRRGGQDEQINGGEASDPCDCRQHVQPEEDRHDPGRRRGHDQGAGVVGVSVGISGVTDSVVTGATTVVAITSSVAVGG